MAQKALESIQAEIKITEDAETKTKLEADMAEAQGKLEEMEQKIKNSKQEFVEAIVPSDNKEGQKPTLDELGVINGDVFMLLAGENKHHIGRVPNGVSYGYNFVPPPPPPRFKILENASD